MPICTYGNYDKQPKLSDENLNELLVELPEGWRIIEHTFMIKNGWFKKKEKKLYELLNPLPNVHGDILEYQIMNFYVPESGTSINTLNVRINWKSYMGIVLFVTSKN